MERLLDNPSFQTYAICSCVLAVKMLASAFYTGYQRQTHRAYVNPEDARVFGRGNVRAEAQEAPEVAHALRVQRNDLENIPAFFAIGLVYVLAGASLIGALWYFWVFTLARVAHTFAYVNHMQPWRAIFYATGVLCMLGMITHIFIALL